jgi:hypothetical protein
MASTLRDVAYTVQPLRARRSAVTQPMPDEQPVTKTALEVHVDPLPDAMPSSDPFFRSSDYASFH